MVINDNQNNEIKWKYTILEIEKVTTNRANKSTKIHYSLNTTILEHKDTQAKLKIRIIITIPAKTG